MTGPFWAVVKAAIGKLDIREWGRREEVETAFSRKPKGNWVAPEGWAGKGGLMDGTLVKPWYGLFPQGWLDGA